MDIKSPQNTLGTLMEYSFVLWQIVFWYIKGKMIHHHHPQDQKQNLCITGNRILGWGSIEVVECKYGHSSLQVKDH
jgi:hypothetical protein